MWSQQISVSFLPPTGAGNSTPDAATEGRTRR
jgi:hypothetical protein